MSFFHQCAVGFFEPTSLVVGEALRVSRPLERGDVNVLAETYLRYDRPMDGRQAMWWDDGYVVVEYIALRQMDHRVAFVRALMTRTGCDAVDVSGRTVRATPWHIKPQLPSEPRCRIG